VIGYFNYINRVAEGVGTDPEPEWESRTYAPHLDTDRTGAP
jgi:hypothetical protein